MCDILSDNSSRTLGFGNPKVFETPYPAIFKTGTSNQHQDIIALGSTTDYTVGCWLGNFEGQTVRRQTGSSIPAVVVRELLDELSRIKTPQKFLQPDDYEKIFVKRVPLVSEWVYIISLVPIVRPKSSFDGFANITAKKKWI